jgi:hypothetical protein
MQAADEGRGKVIKGLANEPRETSYGTSIMIGSYVLVIRSHKREPGRVQVLLQDGVETVADAWYDLGELHAVTRPHLKGQADE